MTRVNAARWQAHGQAAQAQGRSIKEYAREHGLSPYSLYAAVPIAASAPALRVELPNGVVLHRGAHSTTDCLMLIQTLAALPCSR